MKEATGELNMTVVTIVAIAAVGAFFYAFIWPAIQQGMGMNTCKNICPEGKAKQYVVATKSEPAKCVCEDNSTLEIPDTTG